MVESNCQREDVLSSEKAFAYKMRLNATKRQGKRTDLPSVTLAQKIKESEATLSPVGIKLKSYEELAQQVGDSRNQIHRYIRLTYLLPEILTMVDEKRIAFRPAVEISYLTDTEQQCLLDSMKCYEATPSLEQAIKMRL